MCLFKMIDILFVIIATPLVTAKMQSYFWFGNTQITFPYKLILNAFSLYAISTSEKFQRHTPIKETGGIPVYKFDTCLTWEIEAVDISIVV